MSDLKVNTEDLRSIGCRIASAKVRFSNLRNAINAFNRQRPDITDLKYVFSSSDVEMLENIMRALEYIASEFETAEADLNKYRLNLFSINPRIEISEYPEFLRDLFTQNNGNILDLIFRDGSDFNITITNIRDYLLFYRLLGLDLSGLSTRELEGVNYYIGHLRELGYSESEIYTIVFNILESSGAQMFGSLGAHNLGMANDAIEAILENLDSSIEGYQLERGSTWNVFGIDVDSLSPEMLDGVWFYAQHLRELGYSEDEIVVRLSLLLNSDSSTLFSTINARNDGVPGDAISAVVEQLDSRVSSDGYDAVVYYYEYLIGQGYSSEEILSSIIPYIEENGMSGFNTLTGLNHGVPALVIDYATNNLNSNILPRIYNQNLLDTFQLTGNYYANDIHSYSMGGSTVLIDGEGLLPLRVRPDCSGYVTYTLIQNGTFSPDVLEGNYSSYAYQPGGDLEDDLIAAGYEWVPMSDVDAKIDLMPGDIMVRPKIDGKTGHVEVFAGYTGNDSGFEVYTWGSVYDSEPCVCDYSASSRYANYLGYWRYVG